MTDGNILITGASGSLGKQLLYEFTRRGVRPLAQVRGSSDTGFIDSLEVTKRLADLVSDKDLAPLVDGVDTVIHTAAWVNFRRDQASRFMNVNTFAAMRLFRAAQEAKVRRFVHISTVAAIGAVPRSNQTSSSGITRDGLVSEETAFNLEHLSIPYIVTKHAAEVELGKLASASSTELVIVNPSIIVAPSRTGDDRYKASKRVSRLIMPCFPMRVNLVDIRDVAAGIIAAMEKGRPQQRYIIAGDNIGVRDLLLAVSSLLGRMPHLVEVPRTFLNASSRLAVLFDRLRGGGKLSFYPDLVKLLDYDWAYSSMKARDELGYSNRSIYITLTDLLHNNFVGTYQKPAQLPGTETKKRRPS